MLLDSNAETIDSLERPEVLSRLPHLAGSEILEIGAGIGRFSEYFAAQASRLVAVDFHEASCAENRKRLAEISTAEVLCADVTTLSFQPNSFDMIFSNWLLMYLTDAELATFAINCATWLRPGGKLFFRESCFHPSGDAAREFNPTKYRSPSDYFRVFSQFELCNHGRVQSYAVLKQNFNQFFWLLGKPKSQLVASDVAPSEVELPHNLQIKARVLLLSATIIDVSAAVSWANIRGIYLHCVIPLGTAEFPPCSATVSFETRQHVFDCDFLPNSFDTVILHGCNHKTLQGRALLSRATRWLCIGGTLFGADTATVELCTLLGLKNGAGPELVKF